MTTPSDPNIRLSPVDVPRRRRARRRAARTDSHGGPGGGEKNFFFLGGPPPGKGGAPGGGGLPPRAPLGPAERELVKQTQMSRATVARSAGESFEVQNSFGSKRRQCRGDSFQRPNHQVDGSSVTNAHPR